jgi:uncharacterized protein (DUF1800 family)
MALNNFDKNKHLLWRAGFGPLTEEFMQLHNATPKQYWEALKKSSDVMPSPLIVVENSVDGLMNGGQQLDKVTREKRVQMRKQSVEELKSLNLVWLQQIINSKQQLREKLSLFWHGHFATRVINSFYQQELLHILRSYSLGNFRTLLLEVSKSASMINFLNNNQNKKGSPNENFAREVMELFTLGRGHYTENDIKEAARAFTGWGADLQGNFVFRKPQHDAGSKTIFGKSGNFGGTDVLNLLLEKKQTAVFITTKLYKFFVNEKVDAEKINWLAERFYKNDYEILPLLEDIFTSDWFYDEKNIGNKIKSPVELLAGIQRNLPITLQNQMVNLVYQRALGQVLFYPPNVAGWPGGKTWIDSSTIIIRLRLPQLIKDLDTNINTKDDDDVQMGLGKEALKNKGKMNNAIAANIDWNILLNQFKDYKREELLGQMAQTFLQSSAVQVKPNSLEKFIDSSTRETYIKTTALALMSLPEYQLS